MYRKRTEDSDWTFVFDILKIAIGVCIGALAAIFIYEAVLSWRLSEASEQLANELKTQETARKQEQQALLKQKRQQALDQEWAKQQKDNALMAQKAAQLEKQTRRESAWQKFFQPSALCRNDPSRTDCANAYIRARKMFDTQYRD